MEDNKINSLFLLYIKICALAIVAFGLVLIIHQTFLVLNITTLC